MGHDRPVASRVALNVNRKRRNLGVEAPSLRDGEDAY